MGWLVLLAVFCGLLILPALLCCWAGGWLLLFGLAALASWLWLGWLIFMAWWGWRRHEAGDDDYA